MIVTKLIILSLVKSFNLAPAQNVTCISLSHCYYWIVVGTECVPKTDKVTWMLHSLLICFLISITYSVGTIEWE